jgi:hypothetical protein
VIEFFSNIAGLAPELDAWVPTGNLFGDGETLALATAPGIGGPETQATFPLRVDYGGPFVGSLIPHYGGDLYERLHISDTLLSLGNVIGQQVRTITVWNAFMRGHFLAAINASGAEGITLTGGIAAPASFAPLQEASYTLTVGTDGPPAIAAAFTWDFLPYDLVLVITGSRVIPWTFVPDWSAGILERLEWKTDVLQSFDASEQRGALRLGARQRWEFEVFFEGRSRRYAEASAWGWGARVWALPVWIDGQQLGAQLNAGALSVPVATALRAYAAGGLAVVFSDPFTYEVLEVASVGASSITLARATASTWPATATIYPARLARLADQVALPRWSGQASSARLAFEMVTPADYTADAGAVTYRGRPVLTDKPNWVGGFELELSRKLAELDAMTGARVYDDESGIPSARQRMRWTLTSRAEQDTYRRLLYALRGRRGSVWVPTWTDDLVLVATIASGASNIDVDWTGYTRQLNQDTGRRDVRIELASGTILYRRITGAVEVSATVERLSVDAVFPSTIEPADVVQVSFLTLARLDADAIELAHWTSDVSESATTFRGFQHEL